MKRKDGCTVVHPSLLSPRSKACWGVCRAYESGGGGQPQTQRDSFRPAFKSRTGPRGAGARGCGPSARHRGGGFRAVASAARPLRRPCPHSLSGPRRCPHFIAPDARRHGYGPRGPPPTAVVGAPVRPFGPSLPPPAASGPLPCPPWAAGRRPPRPGPLGRPGVMCGPRPGKPGPVKLGRCVARGHLSAKQGQARKRAHFVRPCFAPPPRRLRRRCSGAARPPLCGGCGAVRPSGPVGGAPASLAARPRLRRWPCWQGSASALAARRSRRQPLAAYGGLAGAVGWRVARLRPLSGASA